MRAFLAGVKRWYLRRFKGIVKPPAHAKGQGTTWQQHYSGVPAFACQCGTVLAFGEADLKIISQDHIEGCDGWSGFQPGSGRCNCPVTEARYVKICPQCRMGHWKQAKP